MNTHDVLTDAKLIRVINRLHDLCSETSYRNEHGARAIVVDRDLAHDIDDLTVAIAHKPAGVT